MSLLKGRVAVVTGAGSGIGEGIAKAFVNEGACVAFVGRSGEKLLQATSDLPPERVLCYPCDVSERATVEAMGVEVAGRFGPVDLLVNNAGVNTLRRSVSEVDPLDWGLYDCRQSHRRLQLCSRGVIHNVISNCV